MKMSDVNWEELDKYTWRLRYVGGHKDGEKVWHQQEDKRPCLQQLWSTHEGKFYAWYEQVERSELLNADDVCLVFRGHITRADGKDFLAGRISTDLLEKKVV